MHAGKSFPIEVELYFYNEEKGSMQEALQSGGGGEGDNVIGVALLFKRDHPPYGEEIFLLDGEGGDGDPGRMEFYSGHLIPERMDAYYFYNGSFIDSDCHEPVLWIVDKRVRSLSWSQVTMLESRMRLAADGGGGDFERDHRFRERGHVQPLGDRTVYSSKQLKAPPSKYYNKKKKPDNIDHFFLFIMSIIIFFMQCGFAFMEAGAVK